MSTWVIISWVAVAVMTAVNLLVFLKLKQASEQMLKMAFPNAKNMTEAMTMMQQMMGGLGAVKSAGSRGPGIPASMGNMDPQLKAAMDMLKNMQKQNRK